MVNSVDNPQPTIDPMAHATPLHMSDLPPDNSKNRKKLYMGGLISLVIFVGIIFGITFYLRSSTINNTNEATTPPICNGNKLSADIMIVIDRSSSMSSKESDGRTKLAWARDSAKSMVDRVASIPNVDAKIGVVSFGAQGNDGTGKLSQSYNTALNIGLSSNFSSVKTAIDGITQYSSGTCIECGLRVAHQQLTNEARTRVILLLSDGKANHNWAGSSVSDDGAVAEAGKGRADGITYYVLGYGTGTNINETTLKAIAGPADNYQYKPNVQDWPSAFLTVVDKICVQPTPVPPSNTPTPTPKPTNTPTPSNTPTPTTKPSPSTTPKPSSTVTPTPSPSPTPCVKPDPVTNVKVSCPTCQ